VTHKIFARLAAFALLAALPAGAQVPYSPALPLTRALMALRHDAPMRLRGVRSDGGIDSYNWSGFAVTGSGFTNAKGSWIVPGVNCGKTPNSYVAEWVGLDGYTSTTVEQTGTITVCSGKTAVYYAWYEFYPAEAIQVITGLAVSAGQKISTEVLYNGTEFTLKITNESTGKSFSKSGKVSGAKRNSAEWIVEAPETVTGIAPLGDFGIASFGDDYTAIADTNWATDSSVTGPISDFGKDVESITMVNQSSGAKEAVPSALTTDGSSFKVAWKSE
jgi:Peptidase A4 family